MTDRRGFDGLSPSEVSLVLGTAIKSVERTLDHLNRVMSVDRLTGVLSDHKHLADAFESLRSLRDELGADQATLDASRPRVVRPAE